jgi:hypothetical protein
MIDVPILILAGLSLGVGAVALWRLHARSGRDHQGENVFELLGMHPKEALARAAPPPVDLSRPISGDDHWRAIRNHARDARYRSAVETVRARYTLLSNPMLLSNTIRTTMSRFGMSFHEAMIEVAKDDGLR